MSIFAWVWVCARGYSTCILVEVKGGHQSHRRSPYGKCGCWNQTVALSKRDKPSQLLGCLSRPREKIEKHFHVKLKSHMLVCNILKIWLNFFIIFSNSWFDLFPYHNVYVLTQITIMKSADPTSILKEFLLKHLFCYPDTTFRNITIVH